MSHPRSTRPGTTCASVVAPTPIVVDDPTPIGGAGRIQALDVIRGFALFGVVWMNLFESTTRIVPRPVLDRLATSPLDRVVTFISSWLMQGKAQCLFGVLFGFGFAVFSERVARRNANARLLYARRLTALFLFGCAHFVLLWWGDILHDYALLGFLLLLTPRLSNRVLLATALALLLGSRPFASGVSALSGHDLAADLVRSHADLNAAMWKALSAGDYVLTVQDAFLRVRLIYAGWRLIGLWGPIAGQFLLGAWLFRKRWLQDTARHRTLFGRVALVAMPIGLAMASLAPLRRSLPRALPGTADWVGALLNDVGVLVLAIGYGATIAFLLGSRSMQKRAGGLAAFGRMALTNYVGQSFVYFFVEYGFGLDLFARTGASVDLILGLTVTVTQIALSVWWLDRFRFGPLEWAWRSVTYGQWQRLRP